METLANLESFVKSAQLQSFSEAARRLGLTPAAVSRNVAMLERNLGVRLLQRSTRRITLTEAGERFLDSIGASLDSLQSAIEETSSGAAEPAGVLKVSLSPTLGPAYILPLLPEFLRRYPRVRPEWHFEIRQVDLVREGYDLAIGGGFELTPGVVSRALAPAHIVAVASPGYLRDVALPSHPDELRNLRGVVMRGMATGRIRKWTMLGPNGEEAAAAINEDIVMNDPASMREAARLGLGVAMLALPDVLPDLADRKLVRLLPNWHSDAGTISLYYASRRLLPAKTRVFIEFVIENFRQLGYAQSFDARPEKRVALPRRIGNAKR
ncbi:transcriptional regulator, LysR family [Paraburkholderia atlantica]|uniref:Transcriptional regulator, LysR family n=1 Tax=Paraburkholderia atlantica TaxID=2654982 RepID=D5WMH0_PARAM|nr:LysR family transcriptional regulator [Paraburkholderia atlantica]ADG20416.1 transcriptional regulator, LysR family [Paraburkholderia atlantica]